jgi:hypothetical protein
MTTYTDLLPQTKSEPKGAAIDWTPSTADGPSAGVLTIKSKRAYSSYVVCEFPVDWAGRGFHLAKLDAGTDATEEHYSCFIPKDGSEGRCECKGWAYSRHCKHLAALNALVEAGQL